MASEDDGVNNFYEVAFIRFKLGLVSMNATEKEQGRELLERIYKEWNHFHRPTYTSAKWSVDNGQETRICWGCSLWKYSGYGWVRSVHNQMRKRLMLIQLEQWSSLSPLLYVLLWSARWLLTFQNLLRGWSVLLSQILWLFVQLKNPENILLQVQESFTLRYA